MARYDAIEWIAQAPNDLVSLVPRRWMQTQMQQYKERVSYWRDEGRCDHLAGRVTPTWSGDVDIGSGSGTSKIITADGEISFHIDADFDKYGYLLVLRPAGYSVTGRRDWRGMERQEIGTLICFHQATRQHALVRRGTPYRDCKRLIGAGSYHRSMSPRPGRVWMALSTDNPLLLTPDEAVDHFRKDLGRLLVNRSRKQLDRAA
jgi:hypothetical protein